MEDPLDRRVAAHMLYVAEMLSRLGFTPEDVEQHSSTETISKAGVRCATCYASNACGIRLDMRDDQMLIDIAQVPFFCPNREYLASVCASKNCQLR